MATHEEGFPVLFLHVPEVVVVGYQMFTQAGVVVSQQVPTTLLSTLSKHLPLQVKTIKKVSVNKELFSQVNSKANK